MGAQGVSAERRRATIVALATPPGRGALAIVRLAGLAAPEIARRIGVPADVEPRRATRLRLHACDDATQPLDEAVVTWFPAASSPVGEDLVEFSLHGGSYVSTRVMAALADGGAVPAMAGEFTERAVRNGKMDLLQAEAVADLIDARSQAMHRAALAQLSGTLSRRLLALREALLQVEALLAYDVDFPDEDDGPQPREGVSAAARDVLAALEALGATLPAATLGREGIPVVLAGAPNAGKSSLFNALIGDARAIVSEIPGTTRDAIEVLVDESPYPWRLIDTAGLRETEDRVERLGLEVSARWLAQAGVVLVCGADDAGLDDAMRKTGALTDAVRVPVRTKIDLEAATGAGVIGVSAHDGRGLEELRAAIRAAAASAVPTPAEDAPVVTRARHAAAIDQARAEVSAFIEAWDAGLLPAPVAATHVRAAILTLEELVGAIDIEDVLTRVFRSFCIGK